LAQVANNDLGADGLKSVRLRGVTKQNPNGLAFLQQAWHEPATDPASRSGDKDSHCDSSRSGCHERSSAGDPWIYQMILPLQSL
jgi:hypothetical protein